MLLAVAQQLARSSVGAFAVDKGHVAVDHDPTVAVGLLDPPPFNHLGSHVRS